MQHLLLQPFEGGIGGAGGAGQHTDGEFRQLDRWIELNEIEFGHITPGDTLGNYGNEIRARHDHWCCQYMGHGHHDATLAASGLSQWLINDPLGVAPWRKEEVWQRRVSLWC